MSETIITVKVEGGLVQDVTGVPEGYELHVEDYDEGDESHPAWDTAKECRVTVYRPDGHNRVRRQESVPF